MQVQQVNQAGYPIEEETLISSGIVFGSLDGEEFDTVLALICQKLGVKVVRTNSTKHGNTEIQLQPQD